MCVNRGSRDPDDHSQFFMMTHTMPIAFSLFIQVRGNWEGWGGGGRMCVNRGSRDTSDGSQFLMMAHAMSINYFLPFI